jgi:hypothetical protein
MLRLAFTFPSGTHHVEVRWLRCSRYRFILWYGRELDDEWDRGDDDDDDDSIDTIHVWCSILLL